MAAYGIYASDGRRKKVRTTIPDVSAPPLPDLVKRDFSVGAPGERTCGDITYIPTGEGWLYLADVLDLGSRRLVGFAMAEHMRTELVASGPRHGRRRSRRRRRRHDLPPRPRDPVHVERVPRALRQVPSGPIGRTHRLVPLNRSIFHWQ